MHKAKLLRSHYTRHRCLTVKFVFVSESTNNCVEHLQTAASVKCYL